MSSGCVCCVFLFKQKTAYELRISDWSSDVCSSDLTSVANDTLAWLMEASLEGPTHCIFISIEIRAAFVLCKKIRASSRSQSGRRCDVDQRDLPHCKHYSPLRAAYSIFPGTLNPGVRFLLRLLGAEDRKSTRLN